MHSTDGNIPLRENAVSILFISLERVGIFQFNFAALTQVTLETSCDPYIQNLKHLRIRKLQLFIATYYLQIS